MNEEFHRRQVEAEQKLEHERSSHQSHATMETYQLEQHEANHGHLEAAKGVEFTPQPPTLWQRIKKLLGMS